MLVCDFHVHLHPCFAYDRLFDDVYERCVHHLKNAENGQGEVALVIVDSTKTQAYADICASRSVSHDWCVESAGDGCSACLIKGRRKLHIVQGWQGNTLERLEYISIGTIRPPLEGRALPETVAAIQQAGGIPVIPWGAGKWLGRRGEILRSFLLEVSPDLICLGDNGGRPYGWGESVHFQIARERGITILPGSDPLPIAKDQQRIGSYCGIMADTTVQANLLETFKTTITDNRPVRMVGDRIGVHTFLYLQLKLRKAVGSQLSA